MLGNAKRIRAPIRRPGATRSAALAALALVASMSAAEDFGYSVSQGLLLRVELNTGVVETIGDTGLERSVPALSFAPGDEVLYGVSLVDDSYSLLAIDPWSGDTTTIGPLGVTPHGLAADGAGRLWLGTDTSLYRVDRGTAVSSSRIAPRIRPDPNPLRASI